jgi:hypothetical protein
MKGVRIGTGIVMSLTSRLSDIAAFGHTVRQ